MREKFDAMSEEEKLELAKEYQKALQEEYEEFLKKQKAAEEQHKANEENVIKQQSVSDKKGTATKGKLYKSYTVNKL